MSRCTIEATPGGYRVQTPYDAAFVAALKTTVPHADRQWQKPCWIVSASAGSEVVRLIEVFFSERLTLPQPVPAGATEIRAIELRYLGRCKEREDGLSSAYGYSSGNWSVAFPEPILRGWFCDQIAAPGQPAQQTLYAALGIEQAADEQMIKTAYRRMARQWHPDVCREPDAKDRFIAIQAAYTTLSDPLKRKKYNAGLAFEASLGQQRGTYHTHYDDSYRSPLRCGYILAEGQMHLGRFVVSKIIDWQDIVRPGDGKTLVASWDTATQSIREEWM